MATTIKVGGWYAEKARQEAKGVASAAPEVSTKSVEPAVSAKVVVTKVTAPAPVVPTVPEV